MFGFIKAILIIWIAIVVVRWYNRFNAEKRHDVSDTPRTTPPVEHSGRIVDAEFEDLDDNRRTSS